MAIDVSPANPYTTAPSTTAPCARCAALVELASADYNAQGDIVCARCAATNDIEATEARAVTAMKAAGFANIGTGFLAWFFDPMWIVTIGAVVAAFVVARAVHGDWYPQRMGRVRYLVSAAAITGGLIALLPLLTIIAAIVWASVTSPAR